LLAVVVFGNITIVDPAVMMMMMMLLLLLLLLLFLLFAEVKLL